MTDIHLCQPPCSLWEQPHHSLATAKPLLQNLPFDDSTLQTPLSGCLSSPSHCTDLPCHAQSSATHPRPPQAPVTRISVPTGTCPPGTRCPMDAGNERAPTANLRMPKPPEHSPITPHTGPLATRTQSPFPEVFSEEPHAESQLAGWLLVSVP